MYNGERRSKDDLIFHALGHQDELNASLGIAREYCELNNNGMDKMYDSCISVNIRLNGVVGLLKFNRDYLMLVQPLQRRCRIHLRRN